MSEKKERKVDMVTKRTKPTAEPVLKSWGEVEDALCEIKEIDRFVITTEAEYDEKITKLKGELTQKTDAKLKRKVRLEKDLQEYAEANKDEVKSEKMQKTKELANGFVGFRWKPWSIKLVKKADEVIELLKKKKLTKWIRIKAGVDKDAITRAFDTKKTDDKKLAAVGLKRERKEEFWYTTDKAKAISAEAEVTKLKVA